MNTDPKILEYEWSGLSLEEQCLVMIFALAAFDDMLPQDVIADKIKAVRAIVDLHEKPELQMIKGGLDQ